MATMSHIANVTRAAHETQRTERGANRIPAVWRARVVYVRESTAASGMRAGVWVEIPRFIGEQTHGPLPVVGATPVVGDRVLVAAVEGRKEQLVIVNPGTSAEVETRLASVEHRLDGPIESRLSTVEDTLGTEVFDRLGAHELALDVAEEWLEGHDTRLDALETRATAIEAALDPDPAPIPLEEPFEARRSPTWRVRGRVLELAGIIQANTTQALAPIAYLPSSWPRPAVGRVVEKLVLNGGEAMGVTLGVNTAGTLTFSPNPLGISGTTANYAQTAALSLDGVTIPLW